MNEIDIKNRIIIGALLHDIGKIVQRAEKNPKSRTHQEFGEEFLKEFLKGTSYEFSKIEEYAKYHHFMGKEHPKYDTLDVKNRNNEYLLIAYADNLSAGERFEIRDESVEEKRYWNIKQPLTPVFYKIRLFKNEKPSVSYMSLKPLRLEDIPYPEKNKVELTPKDYENLLTNFKNDFEKIKNNINPDILLYLLEHHFSFVPSYTFVDEGKDQYPDISLFDHLKMTSAIALCIFKYLSEKNSEKQFSQLSSTEIESAIYNENSFIFFGADISGIQDFVYTITSKGALKSLRARSFYLELIINHVAQKIIEKTGLFQGNIIYAGGGNIFILLPNVRNVKDTVISYMKETNDWLYRKTKGRLHLVWSFGEPFKGRSFLMENREGEPSLKELWDDLIKKLNVQKLKKFSDEPDKIFLSSSPFKNPCVICHREEGTEILDEGEEKVCRLCKELIEVGKRLPEVPFIGIGKGYLEIVDESYAFSKEIKPFKRVYKINPSSFGPAEIPFYLGNYTGETKEFDKMVEKTEGVQKIGVLRMDVDSLGYVFQKGFEDKIYSISRLSTLSRMLNLFFKFYLNEIVKRYKNKNGKPKNNLVIVYSGGDDLFIVGPWNEIIDIAFEIREKFKKFTGNNPSLSISGGMVIAGPKYPIYKMAEEAGDAEEEGKSPMDRDNQDEKLENGGLKKKDGFSLFGYKGLSWERWIKLKNEILRPMYRLKENIPRAFIYKIMNLSKMWEEKKWRVLPLIAYTVARAENSKLEKNKDWENLKEKFMSPDYIPYLWQVFSWFDLLTRKTKEER